MPAPITEFVDVSILLTGATAEKFQFGSLLGAFPHSITANRQDGPYFNIQEVVAAGFTAAAEPEIHAWATASFQTLGVASIIVGRIDGADANLTISLDAIEAVDPGSWYITTIASRLDADLALFGTWTEARNGAGGSPRKIGIGQSDDLAVAAYLAWQAATLNRSAGIYHATDAEYLDGAWAGRCGGFNLDVPNGVGTWFGKQLSGVPFDPVTGAQATAIYAANANIFGRNAGLNFASKGTMASGRFIDVTTTVDWSAVRIQESVLSTLVGTPTKIPYTNAGINTMAASVQRVLDAGVVNGHFLPAEQSLPGAEPRVIVPDVKTISPAVKATRELTLSATATIAGAIQKLTLVVNLTF